MALSEENAEGIRITSEDSSLQTSDLGQPRHEKRENLSTEEEESVRSIDGMMSMQNPLHGRGTVVDYPEDMLGGLRDEDLSMQNPLHGRETVVDDPAHYKLGGWRDEDLSMQNPLHGRGTVVDYPEDMLGGLRDEDLSMQNPLHGVER